MSFDIPSYYQYESNETELYKRHLLDLLDDHPMKLLVKILKSIDSNDGEFKEELTKYLEKHAIITRKLQKVK